MSRLRRYSKPGHPYFITCVTYERRPLLIQNADLILQSISYMKRASDYDVPVWVILPDHFHAIIEALGGDISGILQRIKMSFGALLRKRLQEKSGRVWQNRFWDHIIRDERDMNRHMDYIHYNPVKHGYVSRPFDWRYSSIHEHKEYYPPDWGTRGAIEFGAEYGE